jgi:hypothetical protein
VTDIILQILVLQLDNGGFSLNVTTLAIITGIVGGLVAGISFIFRKLDSSQEKQIAKLTEERDLLLEKLLETIQTGERAADAGEEATKLLLKRKKARSTT